MSTFPPPPDEWVTVGQSRLEVVAEMMRSRLEAEGIEATLRGNKASGTAGIINELNITWNNPLGGVEVRVHKKDEAKALQILAEVATIEEQEQEVTEAEREENELIDNESEYAKLGLSPYFQIFFSVLIVLFVLPPVTMVTQNPRLGLLIGTVLAVAFFVHSRLPRK